jgi:ribonuclease R
VSGAGARRKGPGGAGAGPAPSDGVVAVLSKRGRFLVAEPLFPDGRRGDGGRPRGRGASQMVLATSEGRRAGGVQARAGDLVLVRRSARSSGARVVRVLGSPDSAAAVIEALMLDRGLRRGFDPAVEREAADAAAHTAGQEEYERRDLRDLATLTIDPHSARDFDDAISAERVDGETVRAWVHIADVSAHVREGSAIDREARRRSTSVYVPGAVEPMLPERLSNDACSLRPGVERPVVTVELELRGGEVGAAAFYRSVIRSDVRLDYEQVDRIFAGRETAAEPWGAPLAAARQAAAALQAARERAGALVVDSQEPEFAFDRAGNVTGITARSQTESHRLIEHLMIAANEAVARHLQRRGVPCLYRVHERPQAERVERLADQLASLGVPTPPLPDTISSTQAAELVAEMSRLVDQHVRRTGHGRHALGSLVLRSLRQAYYSPKNVGHAGLRSGAYCHFTSPIRRYPDIVCHRALLSTLGAPERAPRAGELAELGTWTSEREREAMIIERDADDVASCFALERELFENGWERVFTGEIRGLIAAGSFVAFSDGTETGEPVYEGMLPVRQMPMRDGERDWWELNEQGTILFGSRSGAAIRLGDPIDVRVARIEKIRGRVDLLPAEPRAGDG